MVPFYANVDTTPEYLSNTTGDVSTDNFYWASRLLAAMADASYAKSVFHIERYTLSVGSKANGIINTYDDAQRGEADPAARAALRTKANEELAAMVRAETTDGLTKVLCALSSGRKKADAGGGVLFLLVHLQRRGGYRIRSYGDTICKIQTILQ